MRRYVARWPDDPEAWVLLANHQYHHPDWMGRSPEEVLEPFDRVIALDSTLATAYFHPVEVSFCIQDPELYRRYMEPLLRVAPDRPPRVERLEQLAEACFGPEGDCYRRWCPSGG